MRLTHRISDRAAGEMTVVVTGISPAVLEGGDPATATLIAALLMISASEETGDPLSAIVGRAVILTGLVGDRRFQKTYEDDPQSV